MIYSSIYIDNLRIEIHNNLLGRETIKVNDEIVSSKYSLLGAKHSFKFEEVDFELTLRTTIFGVVFDLSKNGVPIIESTKSGCRVFILIVIGSALLYHFLFGGK